MMLVSYAIVFVASVGLADAFQISMQLAQFPLFMGLCLFEAVQADIIEHTRKTQPNTKSMSLMRVTPASSGVQTDQEMTLAPLKRNSSSMVQIEPIVATAFGIGFGVFFGSLLVIWLVDIAVAAVAQKVSWLSKSLELEGQGQMLDELLTNEKTNEEKKLIFFKQINEEIRKAQEDSDKEKFELKQDSLESLWKLLGQTAKYFQMLEQHSQGKLSAEDCEILTKEDGTISNIKKGLMDMRAEHKSMEGEMNPGKMSNMIVIEMLKAFIMQTWNGGMVPKSKWCNKDWCKFAIKKVHFGMYKIPMSVTSQIFRSQAMEPSVDGFVTTDGEDAQKCIRDKDNSAWKRPTDCVEVKMNIFLKDASLSSGSFCQFGRYLRNNMLDTKIKMDQTKLKKLANRDPEVTENIKANMLQEATEAGSGDESE